MAKTKLGFSIKFIDKYFALMVRLKSPHILIMFLAAILVVGVALMSYFGKPQPPAQGPEPSFAGGAPIHVEDEEATYREPKPQSFAPEIPPPPREVKIPEEPTESELEEQRLAQLDLPSLMEEKGMKMGSPVFIRAFKEERELEVFLQTADGTFEHLRTYPIAAASGKPGPKFFEGDRQVPEGFYYSSQRSMNPNSTYHLAFNIGYPNEYDRAHGRTGSFIMVHGSNVSIGCLAMTDEKIEEIYALCQAALDVGQPFFRIHIFPFRMTDTRMQQAASSTHYPFWKNLKTGYDYFEENRTPPNVSVRNKLYVFE